MRLLQTWLVLTIVFLTWEANGQSQSWPSYPQDGILRPSSAQCDTTVKTIEGWIYTPNYPSDYDNYRTCIYVIERAHANVCKVQMTVIDFDLQDTDGCTADYLEIQDGRQNQRLCGALATGIKKTLYFPAGLRTITMRFQSDGQLTFKGFMLHLKQIKNSCSSKAPVLPQPRPSKPDDDGEYGYDCDQTIQTLSDSIQSPSFPASYPPGKTCRYLIVRAAPHVCKLELFFKTFKLDRSAGCSGDHVELPDGEKVCGERIPIKEYQFPRRSRALEIKFSSDYYSPGGDEFRGFDILVVQEPNSCGGYTPRPSKTTTHRPPTGPGHYCNMDVVTEEGLIYSPRYPDYYDANEHCTYTIKRYRHDVCEVELDFQKFDLEYSGPGCSKDYLELPGGERLCGRLSRFRRRLRFHGRSSTIQLRFASDSYTHSTGFDISVRQIRNSCRSYPGGSYPGGSYPGGSYPSECNIDIFTQYGRLTSPSYPGRYGPNLRCRYTIRRSDYSVCKVQLLFRVFDIAYSTNCVQDYLELPDRNRLCGSYVQSKTLEFPDEHSNNLVLYFVTDRAGNGKGFDIDVRQLLHSCGSSPHPHSCDEVIKSDIDVITSPSYPSDYPNNAKCTYTIKSFSLTTCRIRLEFLDFDVEDSHGCVADYLEIPTIGERLCGPKKPAIKTLAFPPGSDTIKLVFHSDSHTTRPGFQIRMTQLTNSCYRPIVDPKICQTLSNYSGILTSDNYPLPYNPDTDCYYQIVKSNKLACQVNLRFLEFLVGSENDAACTKDYLEIQGTRYCGNRKGEYIVVGFPPDKKELLLHFVSDAYKEKSGFKIEVHQVIEGCEQPESESQCGHVYVEEQFQIVSPGYQTGTYPSDLNCKYTVKKYSAEVCALEVKYYIFDLEKSDDCTKDYFQVGDIKVCGRLAYDSIRTYQFLEDELTMTLRTDGHRNSAGFFLSAKQIKC